MENQRIAEIAFLALTIWREARGESREVQSGIAYCVLNRVHRPSWWGGDVCGVIFKKWQFSSLTDPNDKQLTTWPSAADPSWQQCLQVAVDTLNLSSANPVPGADSYYDISIPAPKWATAATFVKQLGRVRFYNLDHDVEAVNAG